jgi:hypothetical protein
VSQCIRSRHVGRERGRGERAVYRWPDWLTAFGPPRQGSHFRAPLLAKERRTKTRASCLERERGRQQRRTGERQREREREALTSILNIEQQRTVSKWKIKCKAYQEWACFNHLSFVLSLILSLPLSLSFPSSFEVYLFSLFRFSLSLSLSLSLYFLILSLSHTFHLKPPTEHTSTILNKNVFFLTLKSSHDSLASIEGLARQVPGTGHSSPTRFKRSCKSHIM